MAGMSKRFGKTPPKGSPGKAWRISVYFSVNATGVKSKDMRGTWRVILIKWPGLPENVGLR
jgi:hypothetical protein